jgi:hypothetical protein
MIEKRSNQCSVEILDPERGRLHLQPFLYELE